MGEFEIWDLRFQISDRRAPTPALPRSTGRGRKTVKIQSAPLPENAAQASCLCYDSDRQMRAPPIILTAVCAAIVAFLRLRPTGNGGNEVFLPPDIDSGDTNLAQSPVPPDLVCRMYDVADLIEQLELVPPVLGFDGEPLSDRHYWRFPWQAKDDWIAITDWQVERSLSATPFHGSRAINRWVLRDFMLVFARAQAEPDNRPIKTTFVGDRIVMVAPPAVHESFSLILWQLRRCVLP